MPRHRGVFGDRVYRLLLRLFPRDFRGDFGDQMTDDFREQIQDAAASGRTATVGRVWARTALDIIRRAPREHFEQLRRDTAYAIRLLWRNPLFAIGAIVTLALGIGATTAIYSVVYGLLLRPLPVSDEDSLVVAYATSAGIRDDEPISYPKYQEWRDSSAFADVAAVSRLRLDLTGEGVAERVDAAKVSDNFFTVLGAHAALGRTFTPADRAGSDTPAVISDALWRRRFGGDPSVVGRTLKTGELQVTVVGVMPPRFERWRGEAHIWLPIERIEAPSILGSRGYRIVTPVGRLRPGTSAAQARSILESTDSETDRGIEARSPGNSDRTGVRLLRLREDVVSPRLERLLTMLFAAVALTWLVVCANVSMLLMARGAGRSAELAIRLAIGAGRGHLIRQLLVESAVLALPGGALGAFLASWAVRSFVAFAPAGIFDAASVSFDGPIVAFVIAMTAASALAFGILPALSVSRVTLLPALHTRGPAARLSNALIMAEIAVALVVLVGASLVVKSLVRMQDVPLGFQPERVLTFRVSIPEAKFGEARSGADARYLQVQRELLARLAALPGVDAVTFGGGIFLPDADARTSISFDDGRRLTNGNPKDRPLAPVLHFAGPDYMRVHGVRLVAGREFGDRDDFASPRVVIVNEAMARLHWPGQNPIGKRVNFGYQRRRGSFFDEPWAQVIGVVADIRHGGADMPVRPDIYRAELQYAHHEFDVMMRTSLPPQDVAAQARDQVRALDPDVPVFAARPLADIVASATATTRYSSALLSLFAAITAALCGVGVFSVLAHGIAARHREMGIRIALGAEPRRMVLDVLRQALRLLAAGLGAGLVAAVLAARLLASLLYEVSPHDPAVLICAVVAIAAVALGAAYIPARRAASVDPLVALRAE